MAQKATPAPQATKPCPPPGLEDAGGATEGSMMPAKIAIGDMLKRHAAEVQVVADPFYAPQCTSQGEWVNAVMAVAPYLDALGLQQALNILDCAINNVQQTKALDAILAGAYGGAGEVAARQALAAEAMRAQVTEQQQMLLHQLHCLRISSAAGAGVPMAGFGLPNVAPATKMSGSGPGSTGLAPMNFEGGRANSAMTDRVLNALGHPQPAAYGGGAGRAGGGTRAGHAEAHRPQAERSSRGGSRQVQTLSTSLQVLADEDPDCLFIVRRINKLGFKACRKLKQYFSAYGPVVRVLVAHSTVRQHGDPQSGTRRRPSSLGFVHMGSAEAVREVIAAGMEQEVDGALIRVQRFERQASEEMEEIEEEQATAEPEARATHKGSDWDRQESGVSTVSTRTAASTAASLESEATRADTSGNDQED